MALVVVQLFNLFICQIIHAWLLLTNLLKESTHLSTYYEFNIVLDVGNRKVKNNIAHSSSWIQFKDKTLN